ncbi:MAG: hypothetical protein IT431_02030 [Phycisphaerales bacterium]|nr:hypothetical protein [Phycisphaerales bacterium]
MKIRIVATPHGEAPESVREAWVGLELPVLGRGRPLTVRGVGVLSGPKTLLGGLGAWLRGKGGVETGYPVSGAAAIAALEEVRPEAAAWWREHAPHVTRAGRVLLFQAWACELVDGEG